MHDTFEKQVIFCLKNAFFHLHKQIVILFFNFYLCNPDEFYRVEIKIDY